MVCLNYDYERILNDISENDVAYLQIEDEGYLDYTDGNFCAICCQIADDLNITDNESRIFNVDAADDQSEVPTGYIDLRIEVE